MCKCCNPLVLRVVDVDTTTDPVTLTTDRPLTELAQNHCFELLMFTCSLTNVNTNTVSLTDGTITYPMRVKCSGNPLRYDSLVNFVNRPRECGVVHLKCYLGSDPTPGHVIVRECLCRSSFVPAAAAAEAASVITLAETATASTKKAAATATA